MNAFDDKQIDQTSFAWRDLAGTDRWENFSPTFVSLTVVGTPTYTGRYRIVGASVQLQIDFSATTSVESVAGTTYLILPVAASGLSGIAVMTDQTLKTAVGICHIDVAASRLYLPAQAATGSELYICGSYER